MSVVLLQHCSTSRLLFNCSIVLLYVWWSFAAFSYSIAAATWFYGKGVFLLYHSSTACLLFCLQLCYIAWLQQHDSTSCLLFYCSTVLLHVCCSVATLSYIMAIAIWSTARVLFCNIDLLHVYCLIAALLYFMNVGLLQHCHIAWLLQYDLLQGCFLATLIYFMSVVLLQHSSTSCI